MQTAVSPWRPCCGRCRGERLTEFGYDDPRPHVDAGWRCLDCGAAWDGSELTAAEAADRPPPPADASQAAPGPTATTRLRGD